MVACEDCSGLKDLKDRYGVFRGKYDLPEFSDLNRLFDVEEIDFDSDFLLRKVRRVISERIAGYLRFVEVILNPSNAPMFFFKLIKKLDEGDREVLSEVYEILGKFEIRILGLDVDYSEEKEADFIKDAFNVFDNDVKNKFLSIIGKFNNGDSKVKKGGNGYVG
ncbi:hypothetical protein HOE04_03140 [archaeon]|jgi:hypothetical protein|nr:hypothetical protein [archaeon]